MAFGMTAAQVAMVGIGAGAVTGAMAGGQSSGGGTSTQTSDPWGPQQQYLQDGFGYAKDAYTNASGMGAYTGPRVAGLNPYQTQGANFVGGYAGGYGTQGANALGSSGLSLLQSGQGFGQNANDIYGRSAMDPTQQILNTAGQYANNPYADGMIDAANRDTQRMLTEQQMPSLARGLSGTGNTNSSRGGVESAILQRGAADRMNDTAAGIRSSLFNTGLSQGQSQYNQNLTNMMNANQGLMRTYGAGGDSIISGQAASGNNFDQLSAAGGMFQTQNQNDINAQQSQFAEQRDLPQQLAASYMQSIDGNYGGTRSSTSPSTGGGFSGALTGALGGGLAAYGTVGRLGAFTPPTSGGAYSPFTPTSSGYNFSPYGSGYSNNGFRP